MRQVDGMKVTRLTLGSLPFCPFFEGVLPVPRGVGTGRQMTAEAVVAGPTGEGLNMIGRKRLGFSMVTRDAGDGVEMPRTRPKSSGRKPREYGLGASNTTAKPIPRPEAAQLMEQVVSRANMMAAYVRVVGNKGAAGIDKMTDADLKSFLVEHWPRIREDMLAGRYQPQAVRGVEIPKPGGGVRLLGIPTVVDRLIQQALHQVLMPLFDPGFSPHSYGFRPGRSAHDAVKAARSYVADGRRFVVDMDLEKFLDPVSYCPLVHGVASKSLP